MEFNQDASIDDFIVEEELESDSKTLKDAVLFVVDINKEIFALEEKNEEEALSQYMIIIDSIVIFLKSKIISSLNDVIGVMFYNTFKTKSEAFKNQYIILPLQNPSAEGISYMKSFRKQQTYLDTCGSIQRSNVSLKDVLWNAANILTQFKDYSRRIFLFTNNDNPAGDDLNLKQSIIYQANNLHNLGIEINLFPLKKQIGQPPFNINKFYVSIINFDLSEINESTIDTSSKIQELQQRIRYKLYKKRTINRIYFTLGNDTKVGIKLFCLYNKTRLPTPKQINSQHPDKNVKRLTKNICRSTGKELTQAEIGHYYELSKNNQTHEKVKVQLHKQDLAKIKGIEETGMKLVGFKDKKFLEDYYNYRQSYFIYPDDSLVKGSSQLFDALLKQMAAKGKYGVVKIVPRKGSQVRFGCLIPQLEAYDENDHTQTPPGFHLVFLPYENEINEDIEASDNTLISDEMVNLTKFFISSLEINDFDFIDYLNPSLEQFYSVLESYALGEQPEKIKDLLQPSQKKFQQIEELTVLFDRCLEIESQTHEEEYVAKRKRKHKQLDHTKKKEYQIEEKQRKQKQPNENKKSEKKKNTEDLEKKGIITEKPLTIKQMNELKQRENKQKEIQNENQQIEQILNIDDNQQEKRQQVNQNKPQEQNQQFQLVQLDNEKNQQEQNQIIIKQTNQIIIQTQQKQNSQQNDDKLFCKSILKKLSKNEMVSDKEIIRYCELTGQKI